MFAFIYSFIFLFTEEAGGEGGFLKFYNDYFNIPGFELWKFLNLIIFFAIMAYLLKKPLSEQFKAKREAIRSELIKAENEKQAALSRLAAAEAKLVELGSERSRVLSTAEEEAVADAARILNEAEAEVERLREQSSGEINRLAQQTKVELRRFSAEESIRLAEEKLRSRIDGEKDAALVRSGIQTIGGLS
jgi:F0F1-type ATP synthase membrane subunit b/b'